MQHICGKCRQVMTKGTNYLSVPAFIYRDTITSGTTPEGRTFKASHTESIRDGVVAKRTGCYTCPGCGFVVFYGYNYKIKGHEKVEQSQPAREKVEASA